MADDVLINKAASIERCVARAREEYHIHHLIRRDKLGVLQLPITVAIIEKHLDEFLHYSKALLLRDAARNSKAPE